MTREEAIQVLKGMKRALKERDFRSEHDALNMAIEALSAPQTDLISRELAMERIANDNVVGGMERINEYNNSTEFNEYLDGISDAITTIFCDVPSAVAETMGEVSDGYHTFNQLYHQRAVLFATIVKQNKEKAWKSWKHEDGKFCFDSNKEWFIVGVDTPEGSYTYHYEKKYWDLFDCVELEHGKFWDGHTEEDVTRLLSLPSAEAPYMFSEAYMKQLRFERDYLQDVVDGQWIPCSERLPKEKQEVYVTVYFIEGDTGRAYGYMDGFGRWHLYSTVEGTLNSGYEVIAWMPLPKPYKGGDDI